MANHKYEPIADELKCLTIIDGSMEKDVYKIFRRYVLKKVGAATYYSYFMQGKIEIDPTGSLEFIPGNQIAARYWENCKWLKDANEYLNKIGKGSQNEFAALFAD